MTEKQKIVLFLAFCCAAAAAVLAKKQILDIAFQARSLAVERTIVKEVVVNTTTMVVAAKTLPYGTNLKPSDLKEVQWPIDAIPEGTFRTIPEVFIGDHKRAVLRRINGNEPLLGANITGPSQRASLSSLLESGKQAITIPVNQVKGVAGFVLPGDTVDVMFTFKDRSNDRESEKREEQSTSVLKQGVRVLAIGQNIDDRETKPSVEKTVTLEVDNYDAKRIVLARQIGVVSLSLRKYGEKAREFVGQKVTFADLMNGQSTANTMISPVSANVVDGTTKSLDQSSGAIAVRVIRESLKAQEYSVPVSEVQ